MSHEGGEFDEAHPILVTGASGYIASHIIQQLQETGHRVCGTVRDIENTEKIEPLRKLCPGAKHPLELIQADLLDEDVWPSAVENCLYVIHTASPLPVKNPNHPDEIITPAVQGTLNVLKACHLKGVKRVVLTSSIVAIYTLGDGKTFTEEDWAKAEETESVYSKSKILAEKAAWDYLAGLKEDERFDLVVINPAYVQGPVLCGGWATSMEICKRILERSMPALPKVNFPIADVRDVATAHIAALSSEEAVGKRHIIVAGNLWMKDLAQILDKEFRPLGYNVPLLNAPHLLIRVVALCDKTLRFLLLTWGKTLKFDNSRMKTVLGIEPRELKETMLDMAHSMIQKGFIKKSQKYEQANKN